MAKSSPTRVDTALYESAKDIGEMMDRSAAQQITHWARIGREIEASDEVSVQVVWNVLNGAATYDQLNAKEQAVVRAEWASRMEMFRGELDFASRFAKTGRSYVELDEEGNVVERQATES